MKYQATKAVAYTGAYIELLHSLNNTSMEYDCVGVCMNERRFNTVI